MKNKCVLNFAVLGCFILCASNIAYAQSSYNKFQAVYIYSFAKYISWEKDTTRFIIGVAGESAVIDELRSGAKKSTVGGKPVEIKILDGLSEARSCHIIYLPKKYSRLLPQILAAIEGGETLIVSEEDLSRKGAGISFFVEKNRLRFKINLQALEDLGLNVSKGLLDLAVII